MRDRKGGGAVPGEPLLDVRGLATYFWTEDGVVKAVDGVSFQVFPGERFAIVGESGSGKSVTALSVMRLVDRPGKIVAGEVFFEGRNLLELDEEEMQGVRGAKIAMVFQDPMTSLNPVFTVGHQIMEAILLHQKVSKAEARDRAIELLKEVGIPRAEERIDDYPHQFSGGMRQRAMIAMALSCQPRLLIADEPTTALDVTIQAQILELILGLSEERGTAVILITHDLGIVAGFAERLMVMYAGKVVESGSVEDIYYHSLHPYTWGLMGSLSRLDMKRKDRLEPIPGTPPSLIFLPPGCPFHPRCRYRVEQCRVETPRLLPYTDSHWVSCHLAGEFLEARAGKEGAV